MPKKKSDVVEVTGDTTLNSYKEISFNWKELVSMHRTVSDELVQNTLRFKAIINSELLKEHINKEKVQRLLQAGEMLITTLHTNLVKLHKQHNHKRGKLRNKEDYWLATKLHTHYKAYRNDMLVSIASLNKSAIELTTSLEQKT